MHKPAQNDGHGDHADDGSQQKTAEGIDAEVRKLVDSAYARAGKLLRTNRDKLETLAAALLEKESMDGRDIEELLGLERKS